MGAPAKSRDPRQARIAKLHIARKQLAMEDATYRDILRRLTGKDTSTACSMVELDVMLQEMKRLGFADKATWRKASAKPNVRKIYALWTELRPYVRDNSRAALRHFVQRQTKTDDRPAGVAAPEFLTADDANGVIEALKSWLARERKKAEAAT